MRKLAILFIIGLALCCALETLVAFAVARIADMPGWWGAGVVVLVLFIVSFAVVELVSKEVL